ncbi:DUF6415 family natural product biosynthesis protein [Streptomyces sp. NPDC050439]|uniref:DUF6415 family natural product biosynthesis protein n=1 Tax=unclassified Streptomyces TaxID=2593676 RepID=UPI00343A658A
MSAAAPARRAASPAPAWQSPLSQNELRRVLERITAQEPFLVDAIFDDLDASIGSQAPTAATAGVLIERLRRHLKRLSDIAVADPSYPPTEEMGRLINLGRPLHDEPLPANHQEAVGLARRLAFVVSDLVEALLETRSIKGAE